MIPAQAAWFETAELSDEDAVRQVRGGNTAMFELLMRRYNERLYRAARAITRDDREAEDVVQQAYLNAYAHLGQFSGAARFSTWLTRIAVHEAIARVKRRRRYEPLDEERSVAEPFMSAARRAPDPEREAFTGQLRELLEWAIDGLADGARETFMLREVEGLSTAETAEALGVSEDVVKTRLSRARASLRRALLDRAGATTSAAFRFERPRCDRIVAEVMNRLGSRRDAS